MRPDAIDGPDKVEQTNRRRRLWQPLNLSCCASLPAGVAERPLFMDYVLGKCILRTGMLLISWLSALPDYRRYRTSQEQIGVVP